jgi:hypothetical protein
MPLLDMSTLNKIVDLYHRAVKSDESVQVVKSSGDLHVLKDAAGRYKWLAVYSNSFRDEDGVPEIISSKSQKAFVENVDAGIYEYPVLVFWHNLKWKFGKATVVAFDEVEPGIGFAIAGGDIDAGKEYVAEALLASDVPMKMSHGMPVSGIARERVDSTVYLKHVTTEITVLPADYAANPLTGFGLLGDDNMLSDKKKSEIMGKLGLDMSVLNRLEDSNRNVAAAERDTREYKETTVDEQVEGVQTEAQPEEVAAEVTEQVEEGAQDTPADPGLNIQAILDASKSANEALSGDIAEIKAALDTVADALGVLSVAQKNTLERVEAVEQAREDEVKAQTPTFSASYKDKIDSVIGKPAAEVTQEKATKKGVTGPQEAETKNAEKKFGSSFLGELAAKGS